MSARKTSGRKPAATAPAGTRKAPAKARRAVAAPAQQVEAHAAARELKEALVEASGTRRDRKPQPRKLSAKERETLRGVVIYLDDDARKRLARLAVEQDRTTQDLGVEAINLLFQLYDVDPIA